MENAEERVAAGLISNLSTCCLRMPVDGRHLSLYKNKLIQALSKFATKPMSSRLETVPRDILQLIAFLTTSSSVFEPPVQIQRLLLSSKYIYESLHLHAAPHVFAQIFQSKFDTAALFRRYSSSLTQSLLAEELSNRCRLLRRARRMDFSPVHLTQDLWAALCLIVESDGLNERQLLNNSNFSAFILRLAFNILKEDSPRPQTADCRRPDQHIIIWLLSLALPRRTISDMSKEQRDELYGLIYPFIFMSSRNFQSPFYADQSCRFNNGGYSEQLLGNNNNYSAFRELPNYLGRRLIRFPDTSFAAINLAFVIYEMRQFTIPYHLPENRAMANAAQQTGPTKDDFKAMVNYKTPLFADGLVLLTTTSSTSTDDDHHHHHLVNGFDPRRSMNHDLEFGNLLLRTTGTSTCLDTFVYTPGTLTGVWEGIHRTVVDIPTRRSSLNNPTKAIAADMSGRFIKPMQFSLTEYDCVSSSSSGDEDACPPSDDDIQALAFGVFHSHTGNSRITVGSRRYLKYPAAATATAATAANNNNNNNNPRNCPESVIIVGQTLDDHDQAWSAYRFTGRMYKDGLLVLKRESKEVGSFDGTWFFEGRLQHFGSVIVGRWRIKQCDDESLGWRHGIFSIGKVVDK